MPKDDLFSMHVIVGGKCLEEYSDGSDVYVGWDVSMNGTIMEQITDNDGISQAYPLTPYEIQIETFDEHMTLWYTLFIDGQQVSSRPIFGAYKMNIQGMLDNGCIREFHFTLPKMTENKAERLPQTYQRNIGLIEATVHRCVAVPGSVYEPSTKSTNRVLHRQYQSATKNDAHSGVCTALGRGFGERAIKQPRNHRRQRIKRCELLSTLGLFYRPLSYLSHLIPPVAHNESSNGDINKVCKDQLGVEPMETNDDANNSHTYDVTKHQNGMKTKRSIRQSDFESLTITLSEQPNVVEKTRQSMVKPDFESLTNTLSEQPNVVEKSRQSMVKPDFESLTNTLSEQPNVIEKSRQSMMKPDFESLTNTLSEQPNVVEKSRQSMVKPDFESLTNTLSEQPNVVEKSRQSMLKPDFESLQIAMTETQNVHVSSRRSMAKPDVNILKILNDGVMVQKMNTVCGSSGNHSDHHLTMVERSSPSLKPKVEYLNMLMEENARVACIVNSPGGFTRLAMKPDPMSPCTVISPRKWAIPGTKSVKPEVAWESREVIVINDEDYIDLLDDVSDEGDSVIWYGDDSCYFVDVEPEGPPLINLLDESTEAL